MRKLTMLIVLAGLTVACSQNAATPTPVTPECEKNHTGVLSLTNNSPDGSSRTFQVNGVNWGIATYGQTIRRTVVAGNNYLVQVYRSSNGAYIQGAVVAVTQCGTNGISTTAQVID